MSSTSPTPPPGGRPDALGFFRQRTSRQTDIPSGPTDPDVDAFESEHGKTTGYTRDDLRKLVKQARAEARKTREKTAAGAVSSVPDSRTLERWIRGVGFGAYLMAALGVLFYAASFKNLGWTWDALQPYVVGIIVAGVVLLILSYGLRELNRTKLDDKTRRVFATIILGFFLVILAAAVVWVVYVILQLAGLVPRPNANSPRRPSSLEWSSGLAPAVYQQKPEFGGIPFEIDPAQHMPPYLSTTAFQDVRKRQAQNTGGEKPPYYYLFATRTLQEDELPPRRIGFREAMEAELVAYVQELGDRWTSHRAQGRVSSAGQFLDLPDRSGERRKHVVVLVLYPIDLHTFRKNLEENRGSVDGLLDVRYEP